MATAPMGEIRALAAILDELDYYQVLELDRDAPSSAIRAAYHRASKRFHPDGFRTLDPESRQAVEHVAKRVTEAYSVLRDPRRRRAYDRKLDTGAAALRMPLVEAEAEAERQASVERGGSTPNGRRYFAVASTDMSRGDWAAAERNLKMALTFEPDNEFFREKLADVKSR